MIAASDSRSASVTRSIEFDLRLMVILLSRLRWILPAARAARSATCSISFITVKKSITRRSKRPARCADQSTTRDLASRLIELSYLPAAATVYCVVPRCEKWLPGFHAPRRCAATERNIVLKWNLSQFGHLLTFFLSPPSLPPFAAGE